MTDATGLAGPTPSPSPGIPLDARGVVTARRPVNWPRLIATLAVLAISAALAVSIGTNENLHWDIVGTYLFHPQILIGVVVTLQLSIASVAFAFCLGVLLAAMQQSKSPLLRIMAGFYVWFFRALPLVVQLILWFNLALLFPVLGLGIPGTPLFVGWDTNALITPFVAALLGLALHEAAYMAEIVRGGILSVPDGQTEAALSIGMTPGKALRRIVLPQAIRVIIPPVGNQFIMLLKASALVSIIGGGDLLTKAQNIYSLNYEVIALLIVASIWYMAIISITSTGQYFLEKRMSRSTRAATVQGGPAIRASAEV
ncbi:amino acid ABC transporter permease [Cucumibacter marinus]|uniref:amino acid ABC transporter permease n=1 Tax=Cucumibacter marinus TaxID=1121252 RepID=UPI000426159E|nr:amino acid ABC transporter permease [Cucumibacter marinus]